MPREQEREEEEEQEWPFPTYLSSINTNHRIHITAKKINQSRFSSNLSGDLIIEIIIILNGGEQIFLREKHFGKNHYTVIVIVVIWFKDSATR